MSKLFIVIGAVLFVVVLTVAVWLAWVGFGAIGVAAIWNWFGLHAYFHLAPLTFWQTMGASGALMFLSEMFASKGPSDRLQTAIDDWKERKGL